MRETFIVGDLTKFRNRRRAVVLVERDGRLGEHRGALHNVVAGIVELIEPLRHGFQLLVGDIGEDGMQLFGFARRLVLLVLLPVDPAAYGREEQDSGSRNPRAVSLEEALKLVAAKIFVDFLKECLAAVRWKRQFEPQSEVNRKSAGSFLVVPR